MELFPGLVIGCLVVKTVVLNLKRTKCDLLGQNCADYVKYLRKIRVYKQRPAGHIDLYASFSISYNTVGNIRIKTTL